MEHCLYLCNYKKQTEKMGHAYINNKANSDTAVLTSNADVTMFKYADLNIRFRTSPMLEQYIKVKEWDNGYIVVTARY